ncbi:unnamed protein product, partial [Closterium sp. NIES-54]
HGLPQQLAQQLSPAAKDHLGPSPRVSASSQGQASHRPRVSENHRQATGFSAQTQSR